MQLAPACEQVLELISQLYAVEAGLPEWYALFGEERPAVLAQRRAVRQQHAAPVVERIRQWVLAQRAAPASAFRKALEYMVKLWKGLTVFLDDPVVPIDNNPRRAADARHGPLAPARHIRAALVLVRVLP